MSLKKDELTEIKVKQLMVGQGSPANWKKISRSRYMYNKYCIYLKCSRQKKVFDWNST